MINAVVVDWQCKGRRYRQHKNPSWASLVAIQIEGQPDSQTERQKQVCSVSAGGVPLGKTVVFFIYPRCCVGRPGPDQRVQSFILLHYPAAAGLLSFCCHCFSKNNLCSNLSYYPSIRRHSLDIHPSTLDHTTTATPNATTTQKHIHSLLENPPKHRPFTSPHSLPSCPNKSDLSTTWKLVVYC